MIIRMTVQDNDFVEFLASFAKNLKAKIIFDDNTLKTLEKTVEIFAKSSHDLVVTDEDKSFICSQVNKAFSDYVNRVISDDEQTKHYLISNFSVEIVDSFQEKWENGEYVYYFSNSNVVITQ